jgi:hypothetical protein
VAEATEERKRLEPDVRQAEDPQDRTKDRCHDDYASVKEELT